MIVCGLGRYGRGIADELQRTGHRVLGLDFDPQALEAWAETGHPAVYGDLEDPELAAELPLEYVKWVISSVARRDANLALIHALDHQGFKGKIAVTDDLSERGADLVLRPFSVAAERAVAALASDSDDD